MGLGYVLSKMKGLNDSLNLKGSNGKSDPVYWFGG